MKLGKITKNLQPIAMKAAGAVAGSMAAKFIPFGNDRVKSGVITLVGLVLSTQKGTLGQIGEGVAISGVVKVAQSYGIGGGDSIDGIDGTDGQRFINGIDDLYAGGSIMGTDPTNDYTNTYSN